MFSRNDGLQNQAVVYTTRALEDAPKVFLDPNTLSADGTVALGGLEFTDDGSKAAYAVSAAGSDWLEWHVRDVETGSDLPDVIKWSKFSGAAWLKDGSGFFYCRYDAPTEGQAYSGVNKHQKVYFHALGTPQDRDPLVYARDDQPDWGFAPTVTEDGRYLVISQWEGTNRENRLFVRDLATPGCAHPGLSRQVRRQLPRHRQRRSGVLPHDGQRRRAEPPRGNRPRSRPIRGPGRRSSRSCPGETCSRGAVMAGDRFLVQVRTDAHERLRVHAKDGRFEREITLPVLGTIGGISAKRRSTEAFYAFTSFTYPTTIYRLDPGHRAEHRLQAACRRLHARGVRDRTGVLRVEGRHPRADVPRPSEGPRARRRRPRRSSTATADSTSR